MDNLKRNHSRPFCLEETLFWNALKKGIRAMMILCSIICTGCILYSVILRYIFKGNFYGSDEVILIFALWLYFSGAVHGSYENSHIKADILTATVKNLRIKDAVGLVGQVINAVVNAVLAGWAVNYLLWGLAKMPLSTALKIPLVIPQSAVCVGLVMMLFYHVYYLQKNVRLFWKTGYFSEPQDGDYITSELKAKYPGAQAPVKEAKGVFPSGQKEGR